MIHLFEPQYLPATAYESQEPISTPVIGTSKTRSGGVFAAYDFALVGRASLIRRRIIDWGGRTMVRKRDRCIAFISPEWYRCVGDKPTAMKLAWSR